MSQQVTDAKEALQSNIDSVNTDLLGEIRKVDQSTQSLMNSIREMRDQLTRSSVLMKETVDSVLVKVEAHDKMLWEKFSSSTVQASNTQVPSVPIVPPAVNPAINVAVPVHPNPLYNPNPYFNPMVPSVPFVCPPPVFVGPPPYHPPMVHSSPINPNSSSQSASQAAGDSVCHSSSRDISQLSSPLYDSDQTPLKEVVGSTKSLTMYFEGHADSQKPLGVGNDGDGVGDDGNGDVGGYQGQQNDGPRCNDQRGVPRDPPDRDNRRHHDRHRRHGNNYYGHDQNQGDRNQNQGDRNQNQGDQNQGNNQQQYPYYDPYGYYDYYQWPGYGCPPNY